MNSPSDIINNSPDDSSTVNLYEFRGDEAAECMLENCVRSLLLTPIDGEYAISPTTKRWNRQEIRNSLGILRSVSYENNTSAGGKVGDFALSIKQAFEHFPLTESVTIQVPWYYFELITSGQISNQVLPGVVSRDTAFDDSAEPWSASVADTSYNRTNTSKVRLLTQSANKGTPSLQSLKEAIAEIKSYKRQNGLPIKVILQPIVIVDIEGDSDSRGITASAIYLIRRFFDISYGRYGCFMVDIAKLAKETDCESIIVGTGLSGLSTSSVHGIPMEFRDGMTRTITAVKAVFTGTDAPKIGLSCDLDEITALTPLFSNANVDYIAFNYQPALGSWTDDPDAATPAQQSAKSIYDLDYLRSHIVPPVPDGVVPADKSIVLHNIGCRSIHRGANAPADFTSNPPASNGNQDNLMQRAYIEAILSYFGNLPQYDLSRSSVAAWDIRLHSQIHVARPADIPAWRTGFVLNGKVQPPPAPASKFGNYYYCNSDSDLIVNERTYTSMQISGSEIKRIGEFSNKQQTLKLPRNSPVITALRSGRHPTPITLTIKRGHLTADSPGHTNFRTIWSGRVTGAGRVGDEITLDGRAFSTGLSRIGVNRRYQHSCPHVLYDLGSCRAKRNYISRMATNVDGDNTIELEDNQVSSLAQAEFDRLLGYLIRFNANLDQYKLAQEMWVNGSVSWEQVDSSVTPPVTTTIQARITKIEQANGGLMVHLARPAPKWGVDESGAPVQVPVKLLLGCDHMRTHCRYIHENIQNFGGQPNIPDSNPFNINNLNWW